jgi:hypothetical protein
VEAVEVFLALKARNRAEVSTIKEFLADTSYFAPSALSK